MNDSPTSATPPSPSAGLTFVLGGVRSGKSEYAEHLAAAHGAHVLYIATARVWPDDRSMIDRVAKHCARRPAGWSTLECPLGPAEPCRDLDFSVYDAVMVDCLTLLTLNIMTDHEQDPRPAREAAVRAAVDRLVNTARRSGLPWVVVSSEIGLGGIAGDPLSREYADMLGMANQHVAALADAVYFLAAGLPLRLK